MDVSTTVRRARLEAATRLDATTADRLSGYLELAERGLAAGYDRDRRCFPHTVRRDPGAAPGLRSSGSSDRYTAMAALGLAQLAPERQRAVLAGATAADLAEAVCARAAARPEFGAKALATWSATETGIPVPGRLVAQLCLEVGTLRPRPTVEHAWALTALVAQSTRIGAAAPRAAVEVLLAAQRPSGIFAHTTSRVGRAGVRGHVGCFADQVYPVQALTRYFRATGDRRALDAANRCARAFVAAQGPAGQWWWHYDVRTGSVVEGYPVYSVHQHAMAPMALLELAEAGGDDHLAAVLSGVRWLDHHPDGAEDLVDVEHDVIWRKVGRREPRRAARRVRALATARTPDVRLRWLDRVLPPGPVDHECRPYELGWLLYAWLSGPQPSTRPGRRPTP